MKSGNNDKPGSRFVKGRKQEALAEIEGWVGGSKEQIIKAGAAKVSSQPSKNITEQKMLDSKLYDMSRQRFNFILQCQWQRKLFLEKQKRKTVVMRDLLRNVDVSIIAENPFAKRRDTLKPIGNAFQKLHEDLKGTTSLPRQKTENQDTNSSTRDNVFVTQQGIGFRQNTSEEKKSGSVLGSEKEQESLVEQATNSNRTKTFESIPRTKKLWPLCDSRYTKLSESLSENYPKEIHIQVSSKHTSHRVAVAAGYQ